MAVRNPINSNYTVTDGTVYWDGTRLVTAATGTAGQVLTSNGAGVAPTYQTVGTGASAWNLIQTQTASNSPSLIFNTGISATYHTYVFLVRNILSSSNADVFEFNGSDDGGATWITTNTGGSMYTTNGSTTWTNQTAVNGTYYISSPTIPTTGSGLSGNYWIYGATGAFQCKTTGQFFIYPDSSSNFIQGNSFATIDSLATVNINAFRFIMGTGNIASGIISFYGLTE